MKYPWCNPYPDPKRMLDIRDPYRSDVNYVEKFENELKDFFKTKRDFVCVNSGTSALFFVLHFSMIGGLHTTIPANAYKACFNVPPMFGIPMHAQDVDEAGCILPWNNDTLGIVIDFAGNPANYNKLDGHNYIVNGCESMFTRTSDGEATWDKGLMSCCSFNSEMQLSTLGEGGAVIVDSEWAEKIKQRRDNGGDIHHNWGINCKMTNLQAYVGMKGLEDLAMRQDRRREIWEMYSSELPTLVQNEGESGRLWFLLRCDDVTTVKRELEAFNIYTSQKHDFIFNPDNKPYATAVKVSCNLALPLYPELTNNDVDFIIDKVKKVMYL